jgi:hypothetical protein
MLRRILYWGVAGASLVGGKLDAAQTERAAQRPLEKLRKVTGAVASIMGSLNSNGGRVQAGSIWKRFRRHLRDWLDRSEAEMSSPRVSEVAATSLMTALNTERARGRWLGSESYWFSPWLFGCRLTRRRPADR